MTTEDDARPDEALELDSRLRDADERLATFAGHLSHDLKNPLTAVTMSLEMAIDEVGDLDPEVGADLLPLLERAARGADRMQGMIDDLLAYARGGAEPQLERVDLQSVAEAARGELPPLGADATVEIDALPVVDGDPAQLRSVLRHLLANAVTFTRDGAAPRVSVTARRRDDAWRVEVADSGRGIPAEDCARVFEPFVRLDKTVPGTGVGLSTCQRIVEAHGGRIGIDAAPGGGCVAWFELPAGG